MNYMDIANSSTMLLLYMVPIIIVLVMAVVLMRIAWQEGASVGFTKQQMKDIIKSSAVFSIVPSIAVLLMLTALTFMLGKYFPWLRLSVVGSGIYETMAANMSIGAFGLGSAAEMTSAAFLGVMFVMTVGILTGPVLTTLFNKTYNRILKGDGAKERPFVPFLITAMFIGILVEWIAPYMLDFDNMQSVVAATVGLLSMLGFLLIEKKHPKMENWSMSLAMICGMLGAIITKQIMG